MFVAVRSKPLANVAVFRDISDRVKVEKEREEAYHEVGATGDPPVVWG